MLLLLTMARPSVRSASVRSESSRVRSIGCVDAASRRRPAPGPIGVSNTPGRADRPGRTTCSRGWPRRAAAGTARRRRSARAGSDRPRSRWLVRSAPRIAVVVELAAARIDADRGPVGTVPSSGRARVGFGRYSSQPSVMARTALRSSRTPRRNRDQILQRVERQLLAAAIDHLARCRSSRCASDR